MKKSNVICVIPVRMESTRFPGKPLAKINGVPMIEHVYCNAKKCETLDDVYIATPNVEIKNFMVKRNAKVLMTSPHHKRATDRVAEANEHIKADTVVMLQGDEPMITADMIEEVIQPIYSNVDVQVTNLMSPIRETYNPNIIKVVTDKYNNALYFSRSPVPYKCSTFKQVCTMGYKRDILRLYAELEPSSLELAESVDLLRFIENGINVRMVITDKETHAVDIPEDIQIVERMMK